MLVYGYFKRSKDAHDTDVVVHQAFTEINNLTLECIHCTECLIFCVVSIGSKYGILCAFRKSMIFGFLSHKEIFVVNH